MKKLSVLSIFGLLFVLGACTTSGPRTGASKGNTTVPRSPHFASMQKFADENAAEGVEVNDDPEDVADAEKIEGTPEDLGEIEVSGKRKEEEVTADALADRTFPLVYNEFVDQWIRYFTGRGRGTFERWLGRSTRYIPAMKEVLRKEGLPEDLIYLAMIESGFNPKAASKAKAVGPWQFIKGTGVRFDLEIGYWLDERRDFIKASVAAASYLKELHTIFGSWYLAAASYNAGEGKVLTAVRKDRSRNFWELCRQKKNFRAETRNYVPKIIAAALISKDPEKYGFHNISYENPFTWAYVRVPAGVDLRSVADLIGTEKDELLVLNSELRRGVTPPQEGGYDIKVPPEKKDILLAKVGELKSQKLNKYFITHKVRKGDTISTIARRYGANVQSVLELNDLSRRKQRLKIGSEISVPTNEPGEKRARKEPVVKQIDKASPNKERTTATASNIAPSPGIKPLPGGKYVIQDGDTMWDLSRKWGVSVQSLKKVNKISAKGLRPGQTINVPN